MCFVFRNEVGVVFEVEGECKLLHGCLGIVAHRELGDAKIAVGEICLAKIATTAKQSVGTR